MRNRAFVTAVACSCCLAMVSMPLHGQTSGNSSSQRPAYTFRASTRIVLTDVTVTDAKGNPVHGLRQSDFHIFDNGKPQAMLSFAEHVTTPVADVPPASTAPGVYSNSFLEHLPPVLNIMVIDTTNLEIVDQMYLNYKLNQFIRQLPAGEPLAVYWRTGRRSILLQNFTADHALLLSAVHKALPHFMPTGREYYSDLATLYKIALDFDQYPGRKNILWFTGGSTLFLHTDPKTLFDIPQVDPAAARAIYDMLQSGRIAVYPVDARGLQIKFGQQNFINLSGQHALMNDAARATGGHAYYDNNGLDLITEHWLNNSGDFYTLTYSPSDFKLDNKWHKVSIKLDTNGPEYFLSYRRGYFADGTTFGGNTSRQTRSRLLASGKTVQQPDLQHDPIIFQARIEPLSETSPGAIVAGKSQVTKPKRGTVPYLVRYELPASSYATSVVNGKTEIVVGVGVLAFKADGSKDSGVADRITIYVNQEKLRQNPGFQLPIDQRINLHKGQSYIYLATWDMNSGRIGTLQVPIRVVDPQKTR